MELKATSFGKHLALHPYNRVRLLTAGIEVIGEKHQYLIPFNQLVNIQCKRGIVWGELVFEVLSGQVVRLHGTEWQETLSFYRHLFTLWQQWSEEMSLISAEVLCKQVVAIRHMEQQDKWIQHTGLVFMQQQISNVFASLPLPAQRLNEFEYCRSDYELCLNWLKQGRANIEHFNRRWVERMLDAHHDFFQTITPASLDKSQSRAVVSGGTSVLVLAGAGSGKTSLLVARAGWLLRRQEALPEQILLLVFSSRAADEMNIQIKQQLAAEHVQVRTFHSLALQIIEQSRCKVPVISKLETDSEARRAFLISHWRQQCSEKKAYSKGWRQWLTEELQWVISEGDFWQDSCLAERLVNRLERWLGLMSMHVGSQAEMLKKAAPELRNVFRKRSQLMAPLLKAWKYALKQENTVDFCGVIHQAINVLQKGRFVSQWKHILLDEFQDISSQRALLLSVLRKQNRETCLFAVGDDWQAIDQFSGAKLSLATALGQDFTSQTECMLQKEKYFGIEELYTLDTNYRCNETIDKIASQFVQQNPYQVKKSFNSSKKGNKKAVMILPNEQLAFLLDKLSGYVRQDERILILARYHHLQPKILQKANIRWPKLPLDFMTIHDSKGQQAEYVIILGLHEGDDGFPAAVRESIIEEVMLSEPEDFSHAEERRLLYVAITRARKQVWLLQDTNRPSLFVAQLAKLGVLLQKKP